MEKLVIIFLILFYSSWDETQADNFSIFHDDDCPGHNYQDEVLGDQYAGMSACEAIEECAGFVLRETAEGQVYQLKKLCRLKNVSTSYGRTVYINMDFVPAEDYYDSEDEEPEEEEPVQMAGKCLFSPSILHTFDKNGRTLSNMSLGSCLDHCAVDDGCLLAVHNFMNGSCFLSTTNKDIYPDYYKPHQSKNYFQKRSCEKIDDPDEPCTRAQGPVGGTNGAPFSHHEMFKLHHGNITRIKIHYNWAVYCIQVTYGRGSQALTSPCHGGRHYGFFREIILGENEYIDYVQGLAGDYVDKIFLRSNERSFGPYGRPGGSYFAKSGRLAYISGIYGRFVQQLTFHTFCD